MNDIAWNLRDLKTADGPKVFSTFSCGGGSSMGYKLAGCHLVGANDIDPQMRKHYTRNLNPERYYLAPVKKLIQTDFELDDALFNLDILDGSPPCSSFSMAGSREKTWGKKKHFREGQAVQVLDDLFFDYLALVERLRPKISIAENVKGMLIGNAKGYAKAILRYYKNIGYRPQLFLLNAVNCGVPQARERVFFCAVREDISHQSLILNPKHRVITAGEALGGLSMTDTEFASCRPNNSDKKYWPHTKPGDTYAKAVKRLTGKESFFTHRKLHPNRPAYTLTANSSDTTHWNEMRKLTFMEYKRLSSFPDDYWAESESIGKYMVGMSVPPKMMKCVAEACIKTWL